jgi:hypothetical protein
VADLVQAACWRRRPACTANPLSVDLRERVVAAVSDELSRRAAAARFGVSISSAVRWVELARNSGGVSPKPQGGDQRSARIEVHAPLILGMVEKTPDVTLDVSCGSELPNARLVLYEVCAAPERVTRELFRFVGLDWHAQTGTFISRSTQDENETDYYAVYRSTNAVAQRWRQTMTRADQEAVRIVVKDSPAAHHWPDLRG